MGGGQVLVRSKRDDARGIDVVVRNIVMPLDVVEVDSFRDPIGLVEIFQVAEKIRIVDDPADITFEMTVVHGVEAKQGDEQPPVRLDVSRAEEVALIGKACIELV